MASTRILRPSRGTLPAVATVGLALIVGLVAFEAFLALSSGAVGIPGLVLVQFAGRNGGPEATLAAASPQGGESVSAKLPSARLATPAPSKAVPTPNAPVGDPPRLEGLADIPVKPWSQPEPKQDESKLSEIKTGEKEVLPWDAVEPVPFSSDTPAAAPTSVTTGFPSTATAERPLAAAAPLQLPAIAAIESWVRAKATEIKGQERSRPLSHFEFWLEAPEDIKRRLVAVAYEFNTPAVMPQSQVSREGKTGFRISAGGLTCADQVTVTLQFNTGQSQRVAVDGCRLLRGGS